LEKPEEKDGVGKAHLRRKGGGKRRLLRPLHQAGEKKKNPPRMRGAVRARGPFPSAWRPGRVGKKKVRI